MESVNRNFSPEKQGLSTVAVHVGSEPDPSTGAVIPALSLSTTYKQKELGVFKYEYSRSNNPNRENFEKCIAAMERGKHGFAYASGSAATANIIASLEKGSHVISINDVYGGTYRYFTKICPQFDIDSEFIELVDPEALKAKLRKNTKLVWIESPTNPTLRVTDIKRISEIAHEYGVKVVVDNTFMSPAFQTPLELGADIVVHSVTKYINGHSDVVMGVAVTSCDIIAEKLRFLQNSIGAVPSPFDCYQAHRGLKTLVLRMKQHEKNALAIANVLAKSPYVESVNYPGLPSHPQHELSKRQMRGFGGMLSFYIKGDVNTSKKFLHSTKYFALAESLGGVESLAELPSLMTHGSVSAEDRQKLGITDTLIRMSCGIEDTEDLIEDVLQALENSQ
ncbi:Cystathionine gamma-lyase [Zancudomyces culisetae]|uniref:cystathionine gamma-lyase n=1 Tax=Zancudomyces culisetae TaxID=1213189 RepID=A0A1R1PG79_ZANCU|nr:Cystathionine gamma-lyase [Zancudomyces culisetae]|eukprot:OMH79981.1 Cystathionine gamma-lyase [Zancudomyces culisetae]